MASPQVGVASAEITVPLNPNSYAMLALPRGRIQDREGCQCVQQCLEMGRRDGVWGAGVSGSEFC